MSFQSFAYLISSISIMFVILFFALGLYVSIKYSKDFLLTKKSIAKSLKFALFGIFFLLSSFFFFNIAEIGYSNNLLVITLIFLIVLLGMVMIQYGISLKIANDVEKNDRERYFNRPL